MHNSLLRAFFAAALVLCLLGGLSALLLQPQMPGAARLLIVAGYVALAALCQAGLRGPAVRANRLLGPAVLGGLVLVGAVAAAGGWGLQTPGLLFFGLVVLLANTVGSARLAAACTGLALAEVLALGAAEQAGWLAAPLGVPPLLARLVMPLAVIATGALLGRAVARLLQQHLMAADTREQRFQALLAIATSGYWETDATLHLSQLSRRNRAGQFVPVAAALGRLPWSIPGLRLDADGMARLQAEMARRAPLRDLPISGLPADDATGAPGGPAQARHYLASAEPRFDRTGQFIGYWGVLRDVTAEHRARQALAVTESRYQALFMRIPTPLMLHQGGVIVDANPAAARLLGYGAVPQMLGRSLLRDHLVPAEQAALLARIAQVDALGPDQLLPPTEMSLRTCSGGLLVVKSTAARASHNGAPAVLSIILDETGQRASALALRQSQALLERVVSMSPDIIALADMRSGHYVMVNQSFTRVLGYPAAEVVGRSALALGLWRCAQDRQRLVQAVEADGTVQDMLADLVARDGRVVPLQIAGRRIDIDGQAYLLTNSRDLSEPTRVQLEREAILANASVGIAFTRNRQFVLANAQFEQMYGFAAGTLVGQPGRTVWADDAQYAALGSEVGPALQRGEAVDVERPARRRDGSAFVVRLRARAIDPQNPSTSGTIWIAEDVTGARRAEQELARARDAAEAASQAKSAFLANTSHEIRTPLNGVLGLARLARQPGLAPARQRQYLDQIIDSAELLTAILSDILDVAKIEAGKLQLEQAPFDLGALLQSLSQRFAALAAGQGLAFEAHYGADLPAWVCGDALRVRQIVGNFLHNALKFTPSGQVRLVVRRLARGRLGFQVHDTGPGIDAATQARLFQPFTQADESTTRRFGGTGLGLSICRELATLMGGVVGLRSTAGQGSCFFAELPLPAVAAPPAAAPHADTAADAARLHHARVLLVEDNAVNMMIGVALLNQWGIDTTEAADGEQALALVARQAAAGRPFDAVLMDVQMPGISGYETTLALRRQYSAAQLPVIALTAAALVSERQHAADVGMNDFLTKPVDPLRLRAALLRALGAGLADVSGPAAGGAVPAAAPVSPA